MRLKIHVTFLKEAPLHFYRQQSSIFTPQSYSWAFHRLSHYPFRVCKAHIVVASFGLKYTIKQWQQLLTSNLLTTLLFNTQFWQPIQHSFSTLRYLWAKLALTTSSWIPSRLLLQRWILSRYCKWRLDLLISKQVLLTLLSNFKSSLTMVPHKTNLVFTKQIVAWL